SLLEIRVAWSTPSLPKVPLQITRSPSLTWLASISLTFLLPCAWLTHWVELSYCTVFSSLEPGFRTVKADLSGLLLMTVPSQRSCFAILSIFSIFSWAGAAWTRSEEHTSELQSRGHLVCRLLLEKKKTHTSSY